MLPQRDEHVNVVVIHPPGYVHSLGLLDPALHLRHVLSERGVPVTLTKNRLARGSVNYVIGAHLGFDPSWAEEFDCVFVNLEQLGEGGAAVSPTYLRLLRDHPVVDYHRDNPPVYGRDVQDVPILEFGYVPYLRLRPEDDVDLRDRPIDLLFFGSVGDRRRTVIERFAALGVNVVVGDFGVYGPERDQLIRSAKAVLNVGMYSGTKFEQVRASVVLSCGTPMVAERSGRDAGQPGAYRDVVHWFDGEAVERFVHDEFLSDQFFERSRKMLAAFESAPVSGVYRQLRTSSAGGGVAADCRRINLSMEANGYLQGWLNVSVDAERRPDVVAAPGELMGHTVQRGWWDGTTIEGDAFAVIDVGVLPEGRRPAAAVLDFVVRALAEGGRAVLRWPTSRSAEELNGMLRDVWMGGEHFHRLEKVHVGRSLDFSSTGAGVDVDRVVVQKLPCTLRQTSVARAAAEHYDWYEDAHELD